MPPETLSLNSPSGQIAPIDPIGGRGLPTVPSRAVPKHAIAELAPRRSKYALCIFVINEGERLLAQLGRMRPWMDQVDVIVADGGSTDGSTEISRLKELGVNTLLTKTDTGKLGSQMRMAFAFALDRGYAGVIVMDGNNKDGPEAIPRFIQALDEGIDHVQGSRFVPGGQAINTPPARYWGVRLLHAPFLSVASHAWYTDTTNGFRAYSRRLLLDPEIAVFRDVFTSYELHYYLALQAGRRHFQIREIPVTRAYPAHGPTPSKIHGFSGNFKILKTLWDVCTGKYNLHGPIGNESQSSSATRPSSSSSHPMTNTTRRAA